MALMDQQAIAVQEMSQTGQARRRAADLAVRVGLDSEDSGRLGLVVTEAATNLVKHANGGEIVLCPVTEIGEPAVDMVAMDRGPGIRDLERAIRDGFSTSGSMGTGLGAIIRLSSRFDIYTSEGGTILLSRVGGGADRPSWDVGAICVPCPGESVSGDAWVVAHGTNRASVLMVDGLGHGEGAHAAAQEAVRIFSANAGHSPSSILEKLHQGLRHTRGAAGAVLELDGRDRVARFAGVGNISARLLHQGVSHSMVSNHGTLGHLVRHTNEFTYPWPERALVILHSDGIGTRWDLSRYPGLEPRHPMLIAGTLYRDFSRRRDDATVLAFREAS